MNVEQDARGGSTDRVTRIVLLGKTGNGKSAAGNTILGRQCFESKFSSTSLTNTCSRGEGEVDGQAVVVVDSPGIFNTFDNECTFDFSPCVSHAAPGPHVLLVVISLGRFTEIEQQTTQKIQEIFGPAAEKYSMVLFTHADLLEGSFEEFLGECPELQEVVKRCNGEYQVFNNKSHDRSQVTQLLQKIHRIVAKNGGGHYTDEMFQDAERGNREEKERIARENEEKKCSEKEELERGIQQEFSEKMREKQAEQEREREAEELERRKMKERMDRELREEREKIEEEQRREKLRAEQEMQRVKKELEEKRNQELRDERDRLMRQEEAEQRAERKRKKCIIV